MSEIDFSTFCPNQNVETFNEISNIFLRNYRDLGAMPSPSEINADLKKLKKCLDGLSKITRAELMRREALFYANEMRAILPTGFYSDGFSAVEVLERLTAEKYQHRDGLRGDGFARATLIECAAKLFEMHDGEVTWTAHSPFVAYIDALAAEAGKPINDAPKAIWRFFNE